MDASLEGFLPTVKVDDLQLNHPKRVKTENGYVVLALSHAQDDTRQVVSACAQLCPHAMGDLSYGMVYKGEIECPVHGYRFDLTTGACTHPDDESPLRVYPVQIVDGVVHVKFDKPKWMRD